MKFIPILFSTPMVQAIKEGRKTQTRREVNFPNVFPDLLEDHHSKLVVKDKEVFDLKGESRFALRDRFGKPGDVLWVRETWAPHFIWDGIKPSDIRINHLSCLFYKADGDDPESATGNCVSHQRSRKWRPAIHMPKESCRIFLEVVSIRVERLDEISAQDAISEGIEPLNIYDFPIFRDYMNKTDGWQHPPNSFKSLWESINGAESWDANPWVWVVEFKKIEKPENFLS